MVYPVSAVASDAGVPIWFEPVSVAKAMRATDLLKYVSFFLQHSGGSLSNFSFNVAIEGKLCWAP